MTSTRGKTILWSKAGLLCIFSGILSTGCAGSKYLWQATKGQAQLIQKAKPLAQVIRGPDTPEAIRALLREVPTIKAFGESQGLQPTENYETYVALGRPAVVWVVSASRPLAFDPKIWSFPFVGSFNYLGWFDLEDAQEHAQTLEKEGWEIDVRGASAYSTLGWFRDPILSTMLEKDAGALGSLVNVVLHESVHATMYVPDQSNFNESLAGFLGDRLTEMYFKSGSHAKPAEWEAYKRQGERYEQWTQWLHAASEDLDRLYKSSKSLMEKTQEKKTRIQKLEALLREHHFNVQRPINNAMLIQFRTYHAARKGWDELWKKCGQSPKLFLQALKGIQTSSFSKPHAEDFDSLLMERNCTSSLYTGDR